MKELEELINDIHNNSKKKGFWDVMDIVLDKMFGLHKNNEACKIGVDFTEKEIIQVKKAFISQKLMLIVSELGESIEADRKSRYSDWVEFSKLYSTLRSQNNRHEFCYTNSFEGHIKDTFEDEIADIFIRLFDLTKKLNIDIMKQIKHKMEYNKSRQKLHGKEY